jgi:hypothetical protein
MTVYLLATLQHGSTVLVGRPSTVPRDNTQIATLGPAVDS